MTRAATHNATANAADLSARHFRQVLLWALRLMPLRSASAGPHRPPWQVLRDLGDASPWREIVDEYTGDAAGLHERHDNEFVTFLPCVQRFLYGDGRSALRGGGRDKGGRDADAPMRVARRGAP